MKVSKEKKPWVQFAEQGQLEMAYDCFFSRDSFYRRTRIFTLRLLIAYLGYPILKLVKKKSKISLKDDEIDLSREFVLFWKRPDIVGRYLFSSIFVKIVKENIIPLRALIWFAHWLCFQNMYKFGYSIFRFTHSYIIKNAYGSRLHGELLAIMASHIFHRGSFTYAEYFYSKSNDILKDNNDNFFVVFNLGSWARLGFFKGNNDKLKEIITNYDGLDPSEPDERYGLRVLIYSSYIYFLDGDEATGRLFLESARKCFESSGSRLDRSIFLLVESLISIIHNDLVRAHKQIQSAKAELKKFGRYGYYEYLYTNVEYFLNGNWKKYYENVKHNKFFNNLDMLLDTLTNQKLFKKTSDISEFDNWYKDFFDLSLQSFSNIENLSLNELISTTETIAHSKNVTLTPINTNEVEPYFIVKGIDDTTVFQFNLVINNHFYDIKAESPFKSWRNPKVFNAVDSSLKTFQRLNWSFKLQKDASEKERAQELGRLARSTAHDLRSPLASLSVVMGSIDIEDNHSRNIARGSLTRIGDIANNLLAITKESSDKHFKDKLDSFLVNGLVEALISEKRIEYINKKDITFSTSFSKNTHGSFINVNAVQFKSTLSNIINNSVEAISNKGTIEVSTSLDSTTNSILIHVIDNGRGIHQKYKNQIFEEGFSYNKPQGNGIGLFEAKKLVESWDGSIEIQSRLNEGTDLYLTLPTCSHPEWFANKIDLSRFNKVVILDDDSSIHETWNKKLRNNVLIENFLSAEAFAYYMNENPATDDTFFLIDSELYGEQITGQELISKYGIEKSSFLVTGRFEEEQIISEVKRLNIKLLPKSIAFLIPITFFSENRDKLKVFIVEDEDCYREALKLRLTTDFPDVEFIFHKFPDELLTTSNMISDNSIVLTDYSFGEDKMSGGELVASLKAKHPDASFKSCLISGYESSEFNDKIEFEYIDEFLGKEHQKIGKYISSNLLV